MSEQVCVVTGSTGSDGTGSATVTSTQELILQSGLPPLVREKDQYSSLLTVRNGTAKAMSVSVSAKTTTSAGERALDTKDVNIDAESAAVVSPRDTATLVSATDAVATGQPVAVELLARICAQGRPQTDVIGMRPSQNSCQRNCQWPKFGKLTIARSPMRSICRSTSRGRSTAWSVRDRMT